jgi:dihydroneopterin aldolase
MLRVVKLGGSLHSMPELANCLDALARADKGIILVPGGGPFADTVRLAQTQYGISDAAAHHMAMLAMEQYGLMLCDLKPGLVPVDSPDTIDCTLKQGLTPVWLPSAMCRHASDIPQNWSVSSDSLAAWLAIRLSAASLTLIKYERPADTDPIAMAAAGWVDEAFPFFAGKFDGALHVLDFHEACVISTWLAQPA